MGGLMLAVQQDGQQGTHKKDRQYRNLYVVSKSAYHWKCSLLRPLVVLSYLQGHRASIAAGALIQTCKGLSYAAQAGYVRMLMLSHSKERCMWYSMA